MRIERAETPVEILLASHTIYVGLTAIPTSLEGTERTADANKARAHSLVCSSSQAPPRLGTQA